MVIYPDKRLRLKSEPVVNVGLPEWKIIKKLENTMQKHKGVGLAAIQIGEPLQIMLVKDMVMVNPKIVELSKEIVKFEEGCLSIPMPGAPLQLVKRPKSVIVEWSDPNEGPKRDYFDGLTARVILHEIDHLNGVLYIDHLSSLRLGILRNKQPILNKRI